MGKELFIGTPPITVALRQSARAKRLSLRVSGLDGAVSLTLPPGVSTREAQAFVTEKESWLRRHLAKTIASKEVRPGLSLPVAGHARLIVEGPGRAVRMTDDALIVPKGPDLAGARVRAFLKTQARQVLDGAVQRYCAQIGKTPGRITLRDTRSRWGSCTSEGNLMFSWRLILAPAEVLDYVAAHEVAHLREMNHSPAFWAEVAKMMPEYQTHRVWLKRHGSGLHAYRF